MRVLVVGGTGFLGPRVVTRLSNLGHQVTVYHRGEHEANLPFGVRHVHAAGAAPPIVSFPDELTELAWDVVLAMAPTGEADSSALMRTFRGIARRVVALSSGDVYRAYGVFSGSESGPPDPRPLTEDSVLRESLFPYRGTPGLPDHLQDYEKILVEHAVQSDPAMPGTVLRLPAVYGPGDRQHRFGAAWRRISDRRPAILFGRAHAAFRWTHGYVDDVAEAIVLAVTRERARGRIYNVGEETAPTMAERTEAFGRALGWEGQVVAIDEARLPSHLAAAGNPAQPISYDTSRIRRELDWREITPPETAFRETAEWEDESRAPAPDYSLEDAALADAAATGRRA
ncbi:MAG: NAD-dependent epimerase/dehydratase family protein [Acidobacteriota bacterium]|nr:NAD-dependent epimerase/dehydratase family protein [Acidobacteriota bacterium]